VRRVHTLAQLLALVATFAALACGDSNGPSSVAGVYQLVSENGQALPSDPSAPFGCCLTLAGTLTLADNLTYDLRTNHRNKNNGLEFGNSEQGTYVRGGRDLTFTRTGGGGEGYPYLLAPGQVSSDGETVHLLYGDEGPGSDQTSGVFHR
jgi:hypothetical protein